jgi:ribosomal protein L11 methyltransferase
MSAENVQKVIGRALAEPTYRELLFSDPAAALAGYALTDAQSAFLRQLSRAQFYTIVGGLALHHVVPLRLSRRLRMIPARSDVPLAPTDLPIRLGAGWAFGNGAHPTTRLCLEILEDHLRPGQHVLDLGTGSGILAIAAARLGAASVFALDIAAEAVQVARENVAINVVPQIVRVEHGSLDSALHALSDGRASAADLVVVNILAPVIVELLKGGLAAALKQDGVLIVSGFVEQQEERVHMALREAGLAIMGRRELNEWVALIARQEEKPAGAETAATNERGSVP